MALNIDGTAGISGVDGSASAPALKGTDSNTGINFGTDTVNINTGGTTRATVDSTGRLGIGTSSPTHKLEVVDSSTPIYSRGSGNVGGIRFGNSSHTNGYIYYDNGANMNFHTAGSERMRINSAGNVGIGTNSPTSLLHLNGGTNTTGLFIEGSNSFVILDANANLSGNQVNFIDFKFNGTLKSNIAVGEGLSGGLEINSATDSNIVLASGGGHVQIHQNSSAVPGLGNTTTGACFESIGSSGDSGSALFLSRNIGPALFVNRNNTGTLVEFKASGVGVGSISTNAASLPSDRNFKKNITDLTLGLDFVKTLKPSKYNLKIEKDTDPLLFGLMAQDVEESLTSAGVTKNSVVLCQHNPKEEEAESDYSLNYSGFTPILINCIKELSAKIEVLETKVAALEAA